MDIPVEKIHPNPEQPRRYFDAAELQELANSIRENGVIQPVVVEQAGEDYILHDGERRLRAAKLAGLLTIPASVRPALNGTGPKERLVRALVANVQRADLSPIEEARAYERMIHEFGMSQQDISRKVGKSQVTIANRLALLRLEPEIQELVHRGELHSDRKVCDALLDIPDEKARVKLAKGAAERKSTVKAILTAAKTVSETLQKPKTVSNRPPAVSEALQKSKYAFKQSQWDAVSELGQVPPWPVVEEAARATCRTCVLRATASSAVCRECPAPDMIRRMIETVMVRK